MTNNSNFKRSDDSNPQQGSISTTLSTNTTASTPPTNKTPTDNTTFKIPPTRKDNRKLFVGGLPPGVTDVEFRTYFEQFGSILDSIVMIDRETKCSRGFGFVTFQDPSIATRLIAENVQEDSKSKVNISGKWCEVKASEPKRSFSYGKHGEGGAGRGRSMASTPATSEMSSRNSSIETSSRTSATKKGGELHAVKPDENGNIEEVRVQQVHHFNNHNYNNYQYYNHQSAMPYQQAMGHHNMPYYHHTQAPPMHMNMVQMPPYMYQYPHSQAPPMMAYNYDANGPQQQQYGNYDHAYQQYLPMTMPPQGPYDGHDEYAGQVNHNQGEQQQQPSGEK